ncbi:zinc-binding dehydrogenase [Variovorax dokdonensis]|uniref:Zinc-binding dehydrogenase n=1 Tax=Variovorax dokdonensis TaxID=344883 RepID=A0ABT7NAS1_9BURK|nr:zinc-binding dehydrogenase [Variovorax dokdonensis]MDM0045043.1 zinc-binding dehydrogenase [Variovorax dokdonensis]
MSVTPSSMQALPDRMKGAVLTPQGIAIRELPVPQVGSTELLVKVRASSLNRADLFLAEGRVHGGHGGAGTPLGLEWSGDVVATGGDVTAFKVGDRVMCSGIGGLSEYAVADWRRTFAFPQRNLGYEAAACLPVSLRTTHVAIATTGKLEKGESVLVLGASSGVGLMSLQVAKLLGAGRVIGTSTKADRRARLGEFGADVAIDSNDANWVEQVLEHTAGQGVDLLIDFLAGPLINDSMRAVKVGGRIVNVGRMAGESGHFDFDLHSMRRIQYLGTTFRTRSADEVQEIQHQVQADLWPALEAGRLGVPIDATLPIGRVNEAFDLMKTNGHFGKIVLTQS